MNEELAALDREYRHEVEELPTLPNDLQNLLTATDSATLFLDRQLRVLWFTPTIAGIFDISDDDRGRPLTDFTDRVGGHQLAADAIGVLDRSIPVECEVRSDDGRSLLTRILPYRTSEDRIDAVVITFVDTARRREAESSLRASERGRRMVTAELRGSEAELRESEAQLRVLASDLVQAEHAERRRIAEMLHDDVQQLLFGAQTHLQLLREDVANERLGDLDAHLDETDRYITESIDKTRHLGVELAPPSLDDDDLAVTIHSLVAQMRAFHGLEVDVAIESPLLVRERTVRIVVHQTVRELLFNIVKHANVGRARIEVTLLDGQLDVNVSDDGDGFTIDKLLIDPEWSGHGLGTLRQRLSVVGGSLSLESVPGDGTRARVRLPVEAGGGGSARG